jgi:hypothetical protein
MVSRDFGEQGILREKEVDTQGAAISGSKPFVFLAEGKIRYPWQILDCEDEIDIAGISTIDILKQGKPANENMGNSILSEGTNESFRLGKKRFLIHGRFKLLKEGVAENRSQILTSPERWRRRGSMVGNHHRNLLRDGPGGNVHQRGSPSRRNSPGVIPKRSR